MPAPEFTLDDLDKLGEIAAEIDGGVGETDNLDKVAAFCDAAADYFAETRPVVRYLFPTRPIFASLVRLQRWEAESIAHYAARPDLLARDRTALGPVFGVDITPRERCLLDAYRRRFDWEPSDDFIGVFAAD